MSETTIEVAPATVPYLTKLGESHYQLKHEPYLGLLAPQEGYLSLALSGLAIHCFATPEDLALLQEIKEGDTIEVSVNPTSEVWKAWDPPVEYQVPTGNYTLVVKLVTDDGQGFPLVISSNAPPNQDVSPTQGDSHEPVS